MTKDTELRERQDQALQLLMDGYSPASIARSLAIQHKMTPRTARRYVAKAQLEYFDAPMTRNELEFGVALQIERLDRIADTARETGEVKHEIAAAKAAASMREARLKSLQRETEFNYKTGSQSAPF